MINYAPLRALLARQKRPMQELRDKLSIGTNTISKMNNDSGYVSLEVIDRICNYLDCRIEDVLEHVKDK